MRTIDRAIIHHSATPPDMDIGVLEIDEWHNGRGWEGIGYHYVIRRSGILEPGRSIGISGAHARGHNYNSIGICVVGMGSNFTRHQWAALENLVMGLNENYGGLKILGHRDVNETECPGFDVKEWWKI